MNDNLNDKVERFINDAKIRPCGCIERNGPCDCDGSASAFASSFYSTGRNLLPLAKEIALANAEIARLRESNAEQAERIKELEEIVIDRSNQVNRIADKFRAYRRAK